MNARPRILFYVQHLLGIGHLMRAGTLARALEAGGFETVLVSGGTPVPGFDAGASRFEQLPPVRARDKSFRNLADERGRPIDDAWRAGRRERLLEIHAREAPDVVLVEMYPFGRRQMRFEIEPLLEAARARSPRPLVASSVRDILVAPDKPGRAHEMVARVRRYFDLVLIHGDPDFVAFDETFPLMAEIAAACRYTGYVAEPPAPRGGAGTGEVIVSSGGGAAGDDMLAAAIGARALSTLSAAPWRVLIGHNLAEEEFERYRAAAPGGVIVERSRRDFRQLLANGRLSISQGGYNTVMEVLAARIPAVCLPYAGGLESEQTLRCRLLADRGALETVEPADVSAAKVAAAADRAVARAAERDAARPAGPFPGLDIDGARNTCDILRNALADRSSPGPSA